MAPRRDDLDLSGSASPSEAAPGRPSAEGAGPAGARDDLALSADERHVGPYRIVAELGRGAMGAVYHGRDAGGVEVALKVATGVLDERRRERFLREGQLTARLEHPGVVGVHAAGQHAGKPWLAYELVRGARPLDAAFPERTWVERVELIAETSAAVAAAHRAGVVHRDLKPDNVLIDAEGRVRVADFGLATAADLERLTQTGAVVGTPLYLAPECLRGEATRAPTTDVWSLGVMLYQALTGELPFVADSLPQLVGVLQTPPKPPREHLPELPPRLEAICLRALAPRFEDRFPDAGAFEAALQEWLREAAPARRSSLRWGFVALGLLATAGGALLWARKRADDSTPVASAAPSAASPASPTPSPTPDLARAAPWRDRSERVLERAIAKAPLAYERVRSACRTELRADHPLREVLLGSGRVEPDRLPALLRRWRALRFEQSASQRFEFFLLCDRLARSGCIKALTALGRRVVLEPLVQQSGSPTLRADAKAFAHFVLEEATLRRQNRAARTLGELGSQVAARHYTVNLKGGPGAPPAHQRWVELLDVWRPLPRRSPEAWGRARELVRKGALEASLAPYQEAFSAVDGDDRDQVGLELSQALYTLLRYAWKEDPANPDHLELARSVVAGWESPWLYHQVARREVQLARETQEPLARAEAIRRAAAGVERGLTLQPDHYLLIYHRAALLELRADLSGNPADFERAFAEIELSRLLAGYSEPTRLEQRLKKRLGRE